MNKKKKPTKVIPFAARRREAADLMKFIDAHGGKLGAFLATRSGRRVPHLLRPSAADRVALASPEIVRAAEVSRRQWEQIPEAVPQEHRELACKAARARWAKPRRKL